MGALREIAGNAAALGSVFLAAAGIATGEPWALLGCVVYGMVAAALIKMDV